MINVFKLPKNLNDEISFCRCEVRPANVNLQSTFKFTTFRVFKAVKYLVQTLYGSYFMRKICIFFISCKVTEVYCIQGGFLRPSKLHGFSYAKPAINTFILVTPVYIVR